MNGSVQVPDWPGLLPTPGLASLSFQDSVLDNTPVTTRAGLYVYLNTVLDGRPSFDDDRITKLLQFRYNEDVPALVSDLILASFDVLANAISRNESLKLRNLIRSFITNRLPALLQSHYATLISDPLSPEHCIRQALGRIDPLSSQSFDVLSETRQDFLFACALHELLPESSIEEILGDVPMQSLPAAGRYTRENLVSQLTGDRSQVERYVSQLENMDGNAGPLAEAFMDHLHALCRENDTVALKSACHCIARRPAAMDVMLLFASPHQLLQPICHILDQWPENEDQGEYQSVYEEFSGILLLIMAFQHRHNLTAAEMGIASPTGFLASYLRTFRTSRQGDELSSHENEMLNSWVKGLFETEMISDELMSSCNPGEFHLLVATLFDQSLRACWMNVLTLDMLKGGLEYLLQPFLLPALIACLRWLADRLWELHIDSRRVEVYLQVLLAMIKPPTLSSESSNLHSAVMHIVAPRLESSLQYIQQRFPQRSEPAIALAVLSPYATDNNDRKLAKEVALWATIPKGGTIAAVRHVIQSLVIWSATTAPANDSSPPSLTPHQYQSAVRLHGAHIVLDAMIDEIYNATLQEITLDVVAMTILAMNHSRYVIAGNAMSGLHRLPLSLQAVLQTRYNESAELSTVDMERASVTVRLHRRIVAMSGRLSAAPANGNEFIQSMTAVTEPTAGNDIDAVLAEAEDQTAAAQDFLAVGGAALLGMG